MTQPMPLLLGLLCVLGSAACDSEDSTSGQTTDMSVVDGAIADAETPDMTVQTGEPLTRGSRYCEILLVHFMGGTITAEVWGTQGLSACPAADWAAIDADAIQTETGATQVILNGPRFWLPNSTEGALPDAELRVFGPLQMRLLASLIVDPGAQDESAYTVTVRSCTGTCSPACKSTT